MRSRPASHISPLGAGTLLVVSQCGDSEERLVGARCCATAIHSFAERRRGSIFRLLFSAGGALRDKSSGATGPDRCEIRILVSVLRGRLSCCSLPEICPQIRFGKSRRNPASHQLPPPKRPSEPPVRPPIESRLAVSVSHVPAVRALVMESITDLEDDLPRQVPVESPVGHAVIVFDAAVGYI
jgi:hypothetical protein